jgi:hypothetical protein
MRTYKTALLAIVLALAVTAPAAAAVPGLELVVRGSGPQNSNPDNTATAPCPDGKGLLGLGGKFEGGGGQIVLDAFAPTNDDVTIHGSEDEDGTNAGWNVRAYAICADQGAATRSDLDDQTLSESPKQLTTLGTCGFDRQVTSVGAEIETGANGEMFIDRMVPEPSLQAVTVRGIEDQDGTGASWTLRSHMLCADPLPGLERVVATSLSTSANKHVTASCDAGKRVVGTGGEIVGGGGQVGIQYMIPNAALTQVHVRGAEDQDGTGANWAVRAYALCATA